MAPQVNRVGVGAAQGAQRVLALLADDGDEVQHVEGVADAERVGAAVRRRVVAEVGVDDEVARLGQRVGIALGIGHRLVLVRVDVAVEHQGHREVVALVGHVHVTVNGQPVTGVLDQVAGKRRGRLQRVDDLDQPAAVGACGQGVDGQGSVRIGGGDRRWRNRGGGGPGASGGWRGGRRGFRIPRCRRRGYGRNRGHNCGIRIFGCRQY